MKHPTLDAHEIAHDLWQGGKPPYGTSVAESGFRILVLTAREFQPESVYFPDIKVIHAPNDDHPKFGSLTKEKLRGAVGAARQVTDAIKNGQKVLVTCAAGLNRSGLVSGIVLHMLYGWPGEKCVQVVREKRGPVGDMLPLCNEEFVQVLKNLRARE